MVTADDDAQEAWYQANLVLFRQRQAWKAQIAHLEQEQERLRGEPVRALLLARTKSELAWHFRDRGPGARRFARDASKVQLVERLLADETARLEADRTHLAARLEQEWPDPRWRIRPEDLPD